MTVPPCWNFFTHRRSEGRLIVAPEIRSPLNSVLHPAFFSAARYKAGFWPSVETRASPYVMTSIVHKTFATRQPLSLRAFQKQRCTTFRFAQRPPHGPHKNQRNRSYNPEVKCLQTAYPKWLDGMALRDRRRSTSRRKELKPWQPKLFWTEMLSTVVLFRVNTSRSIRARRLPNIA